MSYPESVKPGQKYNRWFVVSRGERRNGHRMWHVKCECGQDGIVPATHLRSGKSKSCGCYRQDVQRERVTLPPGESNFRRIYWLYKRDAERRELGFEISREEFRTIAQAPCHYCGTESNSHNPRGARANGEHRGNGMDRVDNSQGYTRDNVVSCCSFCNYAKRDHDVKDFLAWIRRAYEHQAAQQPPNVPALWTAI